MTSWSALGTSGSDVAAAFMTAAVAVDPSHRLCRGSAAALNHKLSTGLHTLVPMRRSHGAESQSALHGLCFGHCGGSRVFTDEGMFTGSDIPSF